MEATVLGRVAKDGKNMRWYSAKIKEEPSDERGVTVE